MRGDQPASSKVASRRSATAWLYRRRFALVYVALAASLVFAVGRFHDAQTGFTPLVLFGDHYATKRITPLRDLPLYTYKDSDGYDGQFYAQIAVAGNPFDPELRAALDAPAYRTRRILLPALVYLVGLGRPAWILSAYALSNVLCWLILAWTTARWWFRPTSFDNLVRWAGTMFGAGMIVSVTRSLTDGPSLLLIAAGMRCLELNRRWLAGGLLGAAGLVRETSVLAGTVFVPTIKSASKVWSRELLAVSACVLPAVLWGGVVFIHYGSLSTGPLATPLLGFLGEFKTIASILRKRGLLVAKDDIYVVVALLVQVGFLLSRPRPALAWWRVGAGFAVLALFLGPKVWDDAPAAVPRTLLPLTLAFNALAPRTRAGLALLVAGNLTVLSASRSFDVVPTEQSTFVYGITCDYASGWHEPEHLEMRTWRWASGSAVLNFHNPTAKSLRVDLDFEMLSQTARTVTLDAHGEQQAFPLLLERGVRAHFGPLELLPGDTSLAFNTVEAPWIEPGPNGRPLSFALQNLRLSISPPIPSRF
jgi:hypothetical protein